MRASQVLDFPPELVLVLAQEPVLERLLALSWQELSF